MQPNIRPRVLPVKLAIDFDPQVDLPERDLASGSGFMSITVSNSIPCMALVVTIVVHYAVPSGLVLECGNSEGLSWSSSWVVVHLPRCVAE